MIEDAEQAKQNIEIEAARKKVEKAEKEELAKANAAAIAKGIENYKKAEEEKAKQEKAVKEVKEQVKKAADEEAAKKLKEKELEYKKELEKLTKEAEEAKLEAAALKGLPEDQQMVNIDIFAASMTKSKRFGFPFSMAKNWKVWMHIPLSSAFVKHLLMKNRSSIHYSFRRTPRKVLRLVLPWKRGSMTLSGQMESTYWRLIGIKSSNPKPITNSLFVFLSHHHLSCRQFRTANMDPVEAKAVKAREDHRQGGLQRE